VSDVPLRRLVGVSLNAAIDKTASVEHLVPGAIHRPRVLSVVPGGKAVNVVRAARHLGLAGEVVAVLGGHAGGWYREALAARGIALHAVEVAGETRTCLSVLDEATGSLTEFYEAGVDLAADDWPRIEAGLREALATDGVGAVVVLAGSLPPGAPVDAYARLGTVAAAAGARVVVDIDGEPLAASLAARPWLVKVNGTEAESVTGIVAADAQDAVHAGRALVARGAANAIVTLGIHGAVVVTADGAWAIDGVPVQERGPFTVGSGDAFLAGVAAAVAGGASLPDAMRTGAAAGVANARVPGQGELDRAEVTRLAATFGVAPLGGA
jgi:1-phosphofructokinase family hexose kinase